MMETLEDIASGILGIPAKELKDSLVRRETAEWDSFNHLMLVSEIEKKLGIQFTMADVEKVETYGDLKALVDKKRQ